MTPDDVREQIDVISSMWFSLFESVLSEIASGRLELDASIALARAATEDA